MSRRWFFPSRREGGRWARILSLGSILLLTASLLLTTATTFAQSPGGGTSPPPGSGPSPPTGGETPPPTGGETPPPPGGEFPPGPGGEATPPLPGDGSEAPDDFSGEYGVPVCEGGWTHDDPYKITTYWTPTTKTVQELWNHAEPFDNTIPFGVDLRIGESGFGSMYGDVTYTYTYVGNDWVMTNCVGMQHDIIDSVIEQINMNVFPAEQYLFMQKHSDKNETLYVEEAAILTPGNITPCQIGFSWVEFTAGGQFMPDGLQVTGWEHLDCSDHDVTVGFEEGYLPQFDGTTKVTRTDFWIEYN